MRSFEMETQRQEGLQKMEQLNEAVEKRAGGTRLKKGGGMGGPLLLALGLTAAIAGGAYLGLCAYAQNSAAIWKNTYVL